MTDILAVGEVLIDLTQTAQNNGVPQYAAFPGGAPANVAAAASKLGAATAFCGKIGQDAFGEQLARTLRDIGVSTDALHTASAPTTLAVVSVDETGERSFSFYRDNSADTLLTPDESVAALACAPKVLHFGSVSLTHECARNATLAAVKESKNRGITVSYDPNYRPALWQAESLAISYMAMPLSLVDILKISDDELPLLSGTHDLDAGTRLLCEQGISLVLVTLGPNGVYYRMGENTGIIPGIPVKVADTNGAGDTFLGAVLARLCRREDGILTNLSTPELEDILTFANRAAALTCSRPGAIPAMPKLSELI